MSKNKSLQTNKKEAGYANIIEHLEQFRKCVLICLILVLICFPLAWFFTIYFINFVTDVICPQNIGNMYYTHPLGVFFLKLKIALILALALAMPFVSLQFWKFISPALYLNEKIIIKILCISSFLLFTSGASLALFFVFPTLMQFSIDTQTDNIRPLLSASDSFGMLAWLLLGFGVCFQLPVLIIGLVKIKVLNISQISKSRPYAMVIIFIVAGLLTPPDIISQLTMAIPTVFLFEISLIVCKLINKKEEKRNAK